MKAQTSVLLLVFGVLFTLATPSLHANESAAARPEGAPLRYAAQWYRPFAPRTALDMVRQTPGFTLDEGAARRGLSGAVGNVLVDGRRPSAKEQTLEEILQRIPAAQVQSIELLRGAQTSGDASGQTVLLNVVRTRFTGQGVGSMGFEYAQQHRAMPNGFMAWTGRARSVDYALGASTYSLRRELPGNRALVDGEGAAYGTRRDSSPRDFSEYTVNGEASSEALGGRLRLTAQAHYERYHEDSVIDDYDTSQAFAESSFNPYTERRRSAEFGGHFDRALDDWNLSAVMLLTRGRFDSEITSTKSDALGRQVYLYAQQLQRDSGESILRGALARDIGGAQRLEFGLEAAFNTLDAVLEATQDYGIGIVSVPVPNSNVLIEEARTEAFVNHSWRIDARWSFDWRLAGEFSRLDFSGDSNQIVQLAYAKPSAQLTRSFGKANQLRLRLVRDVGQLDFTDFVSSLSLSDERVDGGNPDLKPQTSWDAELAADLRPGADVALTVAAFHRWVNDTADCVPVGPPDQRVDAPGNIGRARIYGLHVTARVPLPLLPGASLAFDGTRQESRVRDPLTGAVRDISEFQDWQVTAGLRQDLPRAAWGLNYTQKSAVRSFLLEEVDRSRVSPSLDAFLELPLARGLRLRFAAISLLGQPELRDREFHEPDRRAPLSRAELGRRDPGTWYQVGISGSF
jgi:hypothetical protein